MSKEEELFKHIYVDKEIQTDGACSSLELIKFSDRAMIFMFYKRTLKMLIH